MDKVECLSSPDYPGTPLCLTWQGEHLEIAAILARWQTPQGHFYRVRSQDGRDFELYHRPADDAWRIQPIHGG